MGQLAMWGDANDPPATKTTKPKAPRKKGSGKADLMARAFDPEAPTQKRPCENAMIGGTLVAQLPNGNYLDACGVEVKAALVARHYQDNAQGRTLFAQLGIPTAMLVPIPEITMAAGEWD